MTDDEPLEPTSIAQFVEHNRCPRHIKQRVDPGDEPTARNWREAYGSMNIALLGHGEAFETMQVEALATHASKVIGPAEVDDSSTAVPDITVDETWAESPATRVEQLRTALNDAQNLTTTDPTPFILCYQVPLGGQLGSEEVWGEADCLVLAPTAALTQQQQPTHPSETTTATDYSADTETTNDLAEAGTDHTTHLPALDTSNADVVARVFDIKSAREERPAHRVQVATYSALLEQTLAEASTPPCRIETSVLTQPTGADPGESIHPLKLPTFRRSEWELFVERLLAEEGPIEEALADDLTDTSFSLDQVCNNCAYREACATRAVEDPTSPASLALLGLSPSTQETLDDCNITSIRELSTLLPRQLNTHPKDDPPTLDLESETQRTLERALPMPIHEAVQRAQVMRGEVDPAYPRTASPQPIPGKGWVPLPDDRNGNAGSVESGQLIHVSLFVRPDSAIDRVAALGACVYAEDDGEYHTLGEVIEAVPDEPAVADRVERDLLKRFIQQLFETIEAVATALGDPTAAVIHCYTYTEYELDALVEGLDRHPEVAQARALRNLLSLHEDGHTDVDQDIVSAVRPIISEYFAVQYPSQGLVAVAQQFISDWRIKVFDPLTARPDTPPLRTIFRDQFLNHQVPYLADSDRIHLHLAPGPVADGPAAEALTPEEAQPLPDGWYPIRMRAGGQFPIEYLWAAVPKQPGDGTPRLTPESAKAWAVTEEDQTLYRQEIERFVYRTPDKDERIQPADIEYLVERLSYLLLRLVEAIDDEKPHYKDLYCEKIPLDTTQLGTFEPPVTSLPEAARDYLRMEHSEQRDAVVDHYRQSLRERTRTGRSIPIRCTDIDLQSDGSIAITGELAYETLFEDAATARQMARQARLRSGDGPGGGSWRVLTRLQPTARDDATTASERTTAAGDPTVNTPFYTEAGVTDPTRIRHSPPVLVTDLDQESGVVTLTTFSHRFECRAFRVGHCGWDSPVGSNLEQPGQPPAERSASIGARPPVWIDTGDVFILDPMVDNFSARKADEALRPETIGANVLFQQCKALQETGQHPPTLVCPQAPLEEFVDTMETCDGCLTPTEDQAAVITGTEQALLPVQGPPGTGKTSGATAPALLARARACAQAGTAFCGVVIAPSHEAVDGVLEAVVDLLGTWRQATGELADLELLRVLPTAPQHLQRRADDTCSNVEVTYCNYHATAGEAVLERLATRVTGNSREDSDTSPSLLFATPTSLYQALGVIAEASPDIKGETAPAAMRHSDGLADVLCIDEASMVDLPRLLLAASILRPTGQTLLVGDHRQLATVSQVDWTETLRKPIAETQAHRSALGYVRWLNATVDGTPADGRARETDGGAQQTQLGRFLAGDDEHAGTGGDDNGA